MDNDIRLLIEMVGKDNASDEIKKVDGALGGLGDVAKGAVTALAGVGVVAGGAVVAGIGASIKAASDFEAQMSAVKAVSGATADEMGQLSGLALKLGKDTSFSAGEAAAGLEELVKGGVSIPDIMNGAAKATLDLAAAGGVGLADAAEIAANSLAIFNLSGSDMAMVANQIAGAANASSLSVMDFKMSLGAAGTVLAGAGQTFEDSATAIALLGQAGIKGSDAGTSLKTMFANLIPTTKPAIKAMREVGLYTDEAGSAFVNLDGSFKSVGEIADLLEDNLGGLSEAQRSLALETIFGSDAQRAALVLTKAGADGFDDMARNMGKVTAEAVGMEKLNNLNGVMQSLQGSVETAGITLGQAFLPLLTDLAKLAVEAVNAAIPFLEAWGPKVAEAIKQGIDAVKAFVAFIPTLLARAAPIIEAVQIQFEFFADVVEQVLSGDIMGAFKHFVSGMEETRVDIVKQLLDWAKGFIEWVAPMVPKLLAELARVSQEIMTFLAETAVKTVEAIVPMAAAFIDWIGPQIPGLLRELGTFAATMFEWFIAQMPAIGAKLGEWGQAFIEWIAPRIGPMLIELGKLLIEMANWIMGTALPKLQAELVKWGEAFVMWVAKDALPKIGAELDKLMNALLAWTRQAATDAGNAAVQIGRDLVSGIGRGIDQLKGWLGNQAAALAESAISSAKAALRVGSPSVVAAEEIGQPFVWGIGAGMVKEMPWLQGQTRAVVKQGMEDAGAAATHTAANAAIDAYIDAIFKRNQDVIDAGTQLSRDAWKSITPEGAAAAAEAGKAAVDAYIAEVDKGTELSRNAWRRVMGQAPTDAGGGGGGGGDTGGGGTGPRPDTGGTYSGPAQSDPLYMQLLANAGWHSQVPGKGPLDIGPIDYDPLFDTERGHGAAGTNAWKSGHYRVLYRINSLLSAGHETNVQSALRKAVEWVRANTPQQYWGGLGWTIDGRARGGPVWPGRSYLVGERGPELLSMGSRAGQVTPMGGAVYHITVNVAGSVATEGRLVDAIHAGLLRKQRYNSSLGLT